MEYFITYVVIAILLATTLSTLDKLNKLPCNWDEVHMTLMPLLWPIAVPLVLTTIVINISSTYLSNLIRNYHERNSNPKH